MGQVIRFPIERRLSSRRTEIHAHEGSASVVILPAVRIERHGAMGEAPLAAAKSIAAPIGSGTLGA